MVGFGLKNVQNCELAEISHKAILATFYQMCGRLWIEECSKLWTCRNFPQGCINNMVSNATIGLGYVIQNVGNYGGDADRLVYNTNHTFIVGSK